jgi:hypothetical protein
VEAVKPSRIRILNLRKDRGLACDEMVRIRLKGAMVMLTSWDKQERVLPFNSIMFVVLLLR